MIGNKLYPFFTAQEEDLEEYKPEEKEIGEETSKEEEEKEKEKEKDEDEDEDKDETDDEM